MPAIDYTLGSKIVLVALKLWALRETGALSVAASLADSALDLIASLGGLAAILYAAKPPDSNVSVKGNPAVGSGSSSKICMARAPFRGLCGLLSSHPFDRGGTPPVSGEFGKTFETVDRPDSSKGT